MCFGKSKSNPPPVPAPAQPTQFSYINADTSNSQQRQAAIQSSTQGSTPQSFGAELGGSAPAAPTTTSTGM